MEGGCTYFVIVDPSLGNLEILRFLKHMKDGFKRVSKNGFHGELVPIIQQLIASLERTPRPTNSVDASLEEAKSVDGSSMSGKTPLLGNSKHDRRKMKDKGVENDEVCEDRRDEGVKIHMPPEPTGNMSLQKSSSLMRAQEPQIGQVVVVICESSCCCRHYPLPDFVWCLVGCPQGFPVYFEFIVKMGKIWRAKMVLELEARNISSNIILKCLLT